MDSALWFVFQFEYSGGFVRGYVVFQANAPSKEKREARTTMKPFRCLSHIQVSFVRFSIIFYFNPGELIFALQLQYHVVYSHVQLKNIEK